MSPILCLLNLVVPAQPDVIGLAQLHRLDLLPAFKTSVRIGAITSYDRSGGNDDGFSGKYSFVRKEGDALVLADIQGPGCIYRIHTPTPTDDPLEIYFDGEATPRIKMPLRDLFSGRVSPFLRPLVDYAGGGYTCYVPLPFAKSCKVLVRAKQFQFYDLNFAQYPVGSSIQTFTMTPPLRDLNAAKAVFDMNGPELTKFNVPAGTALKRMPFDVSLKAGKSVTLFQTNKPGRIAALRIGPSDAFVGKNRDLYLRVTWDGETKPAIFCPAGDFFGYAWGKPAMGSRLVGTRDGMNYCYLPMPFKRSARVELVSLQAGGSPLTFRGEVVLSNVPQKPDEGKFYAVWRRENPTTKGKPFTFLESKGRGHIVGLALQAQGKESGNTYFFEGDDQTTVDGELLVHGTGSEDFFNGGWYDVPDRWDAQFARALSGCLAYQKPLGRTGAYRFMIGDAYSYRKSILQTIEHGGEGNAHPSDYCAMTYLYSENPPTALPALGDRKVSDPEKVIFAAHWTTPISSFAFGGGTLSRHDVPLEKGNTRCLSLRAQGEDFFGPPFVSLVCDLPSAGTYKVYADVVKGPEQAQVQLFKEESAAGEPVDLFTDKSALATSVYLGEIMAAEGNNRLMFKLVGKDPRAKVFGFDLINVICIRKK